jgi:hypothetical protein
LPYARAEALAKCNGDIYLDGLTSLSDAAAEALVKHKGRISLQSLENLSENAIRYLSLHEKVFTPKIGYLPKLKI